MAYYHHRKLFTPGPVPIEKHILAIGSEQPPYNRTEEFSQFTREIIGGLQQVFQTDGSVALLTGSGTAAMEAAVLNFLDASDKVLIVNGGAFGQRWCDLCKIHSIPYEALSMEAGKDLDLLQLEEQISRNKYSAILINAHETSTGYLYDIESIGRIAKEFNLLTIVDAIGTICADPFFMDKWNVDVAILSSQKGLALPPGLSFVAMSARAVSRLNRINPKTCYLNLKDYLANQERGQLPYTPAIGILVQLHQRLLDIKRITLPILIEQHRKIATEFRDAIADLPFSQLPERQSNALTALVCEDMNALSIVHHLRHHHDIEITPNGGDLKDRVFRISHMGAQRKADILTLIKGLKEVVFSGQLI